METPCKRKLELKSTFARAIGEGLNATMIFVTAAIKDDRRHAFFQTALRDQLADLLGRVHVAAGLQRRTQCRVYRGGRHKGVSRRIVNQLGVDVLQTARHVQARALAVPATL